MTLVKRLPSEDARGTRKIKGNDRPSKVWSGSDGGPSQTNPVLSLIQGSNCQSPIAKESRSQKAKSQVVKKEGQVTQQQLKSSEGGGWGHFGKHAAHDGRKARSEDRREQA